MSIMSWPFKNGYNNAEGCACHGQTFCPNYVCVGYNEDDTPDFMHKNVVAQIKEIRERNKPIDYRI